ncbi:oxidoreductase [uncultured Photobacterium sp.]|uniref:oxidoreductase n=1 Tax=uncultured Photobacterium sp. TaxID=173973 RepID=UPI002633E667|nr:oxidoreductase [uncultured Photobacterium sp.]
MSIRLSFFTAQLLAFTLVIAFSPPTQAYETTLSLEGRNTSGEYVTITLTRKQIEQLPQSTLTTHLPWFKGQAKFKGVKLTTLLSAYQLEPALIKMSALNDYSAEVSKQHIEKYQPIIAIAKDGEYLRIRDYGPYWLVFSIDQYPELGQSQNLAKMVWQLEHIIAN